MRRPIKKRSTRAGEHRPVLLEETLTALDLRPGITVVDCTVGWAGHGVEILRRIGPTGTLLGLDLDAENIPRARERLESVGYPFHLHHMNFAGLQQVLAQHGIDQVDAIVADLGMSSMQVDDPARGFSYARDGTLDMRMDRTRGQTAAQLLATIDETELCAALRQIGDEPHAKTIARAIAEARMATPIDTTSQLADIIRNATQQTDWRLHPAAGKWNLHPAARTFQTLRILVNRELGNLENLLRILPQCLRAHGRAAIISFHSGEDRLVKNAFKAGRDVGRYADTSPDPIRAGWSEIQSNPRSRSAKLRWALRGEKK